MGTGVDPGGGVGVSVGSGPEQQPFGEGRRLVDKAEHDDGQHEVGLAVHATTVKQ